MRLRFGRAFLKVTECYDYETIVKPRFEKDVAKALKTNEALQKKLDAAEAKAAQLAEDVENAKKSASALTEQA